MTTMVDRVSSEARDVRVGRALLVGVAGFFYGIGYVARKMCLGVAWSFAAVRVGWKDAGNR